MIDQKLKLQGIGISLLMLINTLGLQAISDKVVFEKVRTQNNQNVTIIHSILHGSDGFIWMGTVDGLFRYDGNSYKIFRHVKDDPESLSSNSIRCIFEDRDGFIWIGTQGGGICKFDKESEKFTTFNQEFGFNSDNAWEIFQDKSGYLWIGTWNYGLFRTLPLSGTDEIEQFESFRFDKEDPTSISHNIIREIFEDSKNNMWFGTQGGGLNKLNKKTNSFVRYQAAPDNDGALLNNGVYAILEDSDGSLWIGTNGGGLHEFNPKTGVFIRHYEDFSNRITSLKKISKKSLLIGTESGIRFFNTEEKTFHYLHETPGNSNELNDKLIRTVYIDNKNMAWVGTESGLYKQAITKNFHHFRHEPFDGNSLSFNTIRAIHEDGHGKLWIGTLGKGLNVYDPKPQKWSIINSSSRSIRGLKDNTITSIYIDKNNVVWIGTNNGYLHKYTDGSKYMQSFLLEKQPLNTPNIIQGIIGDENGVIWVGTENGICRFDSKNNTWRHIKHDPKNEASLSGNNIQSKALAFDLDGNLWVGTWSNGLNFISADELYKINPKVSHWKFDEFNHNSISNNNILAIHADKRGIIWLGTYGGGLNSYDPKKNKFKAFTTDEGLPNNIIFGILEDEVGNLWLSTNNGLARFNPEDESCVTYSVSDGLQGNAFFWGASHKSAGGNMYVGGQNGFNMFLPDEIQQNKQEPDIVITGVSVFNKEKEFSKVVHKLNKIKLSHLDKYLTIRFAALDFTEPSRNQYKYMLEGFDADWVDCGTENSANYTNLPGGHYTFRVIGSNNDGIWNNKGVSLAIYIVPSLWETTWFRILILVLFIVLIFSSYFIRVNRINKKQVSLQRMVDARTLELNLANNKLADNNKELSAQHEELELQRNYILSQNSELEEHRNNLENIVIERTKQLEQAKNKAEESDRIKTAFLTNMSHELRTPLNAIVGFSNLLNEQDITPEEKSEYVDHINVNSDSLLVLVNDILDLSNIESEHLQFSEESFALKEILTEITSYWHQQSLNKKIDFRFDLSNVNSHQVNTDRHRLKQILTNFINNAFKFTEKGFVKLSVDIKPEEYVFAVEDTGIGIPEEHKEVIFDRFTKLENVSTKKLYRGSGLGLAIAARLADLLHGKIWVDSTVNEGSTFYLSLPREKSDDMDSKYLKGLPNLKEFNWETRSVLIVEDEKTNYLYLKSLLRKTGIQTSWAQNGLEAVTNYEEHGFYDIILMDIKMPVMDGFEALEKILDIDSNQKVIAQTAYAMTSDRKKVFDAGFVDYLAKPISPEKLIRCISKYL